MAGKIAYFEVDVSDPLGKAEAMRSRVEPGGLRAFLLGVMYPHLQRRIALRFDREGDDASGKWAQLAAATIHMRQAQGFPGAHPINVRTGGMKRHLLDSKSITYGGSVLNVPATSTGLTRKKIAVAQNGRDFGNTPARPVLALNSVDTIIGTEALMQWIMSGGTRGAMISAGAS